MRRMPNVSDPVNAVEAIDDPMKSGVLSSWLMAVCMYRRKTRIISPAVVAFSVFVTAIPCRAEPNILAGKAFAQANCSRCHSIDKFTQSPLAIAPPFRTLHERYPVESLEEALGEGIATGHPSMPEFRLDPGRVGDFISFLKSLEQ
jgi:cytochrome c